MPNDPKWPPRWQSLRRNVVDLPHRAEVGRKANERYLEGLAGFTETRSLKELAEPMTRRVPPSGSPRHFLLRLLRAHNLLAKIPGTHR
jgi:hypothetical protein